MEQGTADSADISEIIFFGRCVSAVLFILFKAENFIKKYVNKIIIIIVVKIIQKDCIILHKSNSHST